MALAVALAGAIVAPLRAAPPTDPSLLPEPVQAAWASTLAIEFDAGKRHRIGSLTFIRALSPERALFLTAAHVVCDPERRWRLDPARAVVGFGRGDRRNADGPGTVTGVACSREVDLAAVHVGLAARVLANLRPARIAPPHYFPWTVYTVGFAESSQFRRQWHGGARVCRAELTVNASRATYFAHDAEVAPGYSGGPLVDGSGILVGINIALPEAKPLAPALLGACTRRDPGLVPRSLTLAIDPGMVEAIAAAVR